MRARSVLLTLAALVSAGALRGQELRSTPVAEPQYLNSFYAVDADGKLIELERQTVTFLRLAASAQFIVRGRAPIDPVSRFDLRALKGSKDHREFVMTQGHGSVFGGSATSNPEEGALAIRFEEYGANSYRITPDKPLAAGEYALAVRGLVSELYCFGVDP